MNEERIRELAQQAGLKMIHDETLALGYLNTPTKKFAKLIIKECLEACSRANEIRHFVPPTQEQVVLSCMREIETTFWD